ncbi:inner membrane magnesium transporter MRS2 [Apiospora hydei]|uniref:Magnesium transporter n=1 Tax=Apiospora hydei TaxID=1337664 RepID=A0ABR1VIB1_9PEZI
MATARLPVPSRGLLRFLRLQTENLSFFSQNHGQLGPHSSGVFCAARKQLRPSRTGCASLGQDGPRLHSSLVNLEQLLQKRTPRASPNPRPRQSTLFSTENGARWGSSDQQSDPTACKQTWQEKLWGNRPRKPPASTLKPEDIPETDGEGENNSMFNKRRQLSSKAALEPRLRCTEVDENGDAVLVDSEFKKSELVARFGLLPRDLRKIDSSNLPHILVRERAILLNLLHLRVLITHNRVLLFDVYGSKSSYPQSAFMYDLHHKLHNKTPATNGGLSYEFRALEAVLQSVTQELESDFEAVRDPVIRILSDLEDDIDRHKLRVLLILSKRVTTFEQKAKLVRDAIEDLLEADDDLAAMYLTEKTHDIYRAPDDHTDVELLLESYHKFCDEIVQEAGNLVSGIRNTEEIIRAILDANRNALMLLELKFSVGTLGLAMGTFIAGLYGMNLENFIEETNWGFGAVTGVSVILSIWVCVIGMKRLRSLQRVKMQGTDRRGVEQGYHWFQDDGHAGLLDPRSREKLRRMNMMKTQHTTSKKRWWMGA